MSNSIKIVECPRDAWQGLPAHIPAAQKAAYLRQLIAAGFTHIDAASFVSPAAIPQMADSEHVLQLLGPHPNAELIGIVVNERGAARAIATQAINALGFPYSISPEFLRRNQNQTQQQSLAILQSISKAAHNANLSVVAYVSMAFGNPYRDPWSINEVTAACNALINQGVKQISLADTVGLSTPAQIADVLNAVSTLSNQAEIGVHLHARPHEAPDKIRAAYAAGCRRFDSALGGLGGCPMAQDDLVGNIPTETLIATLQALGADMPPLSPLDDLIRTNAQIATTFSPAT